VLDGPQSIALEQAENRLHLQKALMERLVAANPRTIPAETHARPAVSRAAETILG
jgi:hypothetical protein